MEYACEFSGSKVILILGHDNCGAGQSASKGVQAGNITQLLEKIKPAVDSACAKYECDPNCKDFNNKVVAKNVKLMKN